MVAKVIIGKSIRGALLYNERKVQEGHARCLSANLFGGDPNQLGFASKLKRFEKLIARNAKAKTNVLHISLNFDVMEKLPASSLYSIANDYMEKIGFGNQPYLVYEHLDAAHPHLHILTTNITETGKRIDLHNIGRNQSEKARKEIELTYGLVQAESKSKKELPLLIPPVRLTYGKSETKRSISNVVRCAMAYKFTSLPEFNAILRQFNVVADRGREGSWMYRKKGLVYSCCDTKGTPVGVPIKASSIYSTPTLQNIENRFAVNKKLRLPGKDRIRVCIDRCFKNKSITTKEAFAESLQQQGIYVLLRQSKEGLIYGITFVDNVSKVVFNGSDLGKNYSASALLSRISNSPATGSASAAPSTRDADTGEIVIEWNTGMSPIISDVITAQQYDFSSPDKVFKRRKKKRKGPSH